MTECEIACYERLLAGSSYVIEYGCGGSTILAVSARVRRIVSVEADPNWLAKLRQEPEIIEAEASRRLTFKFVDIGPVGNWSYPTDDSQRKQWPRYPAAAWRRTFRDRLLRAKPDLVLIDGRFRVACAVETATHAARGTVVVIHDFCNRPQYAIVGEFLEEADRIDKMALFRAPGGLSRRARNTLLTRYGHEPQ